jgi:hypothetical protein
MAVSFSMPYREINKALAEMFGKGQVELRKDNNPVTRKPRKVQRWLEKKI